MTTIPNLCSLISLTLRPTPSPLQPDTTPIRRQEIVRFSTMPETYWGTPAIQKLVALQVVNGTDNGTFEPEKRRRD